MSGVRPEDLIKREIKKRGMTMAAASKMSGVKYFGLQQALKGNRKLRTDEYLSLCLLLNVDPRAYRNAG